jgi:hypothetical protein
MQAKINKWRSCERKRRLNEESARAYARQVTAKGLVKLRVYRCDWCSHWHVTKSRRRPKP